ncbi:MAG TPA: hypothetical protein VI937_00605 [Negativicutes bacterium]|nr:hypothetical protein [Negativicutes bacterium]
MLVKIKEKERAIQLRKDGLSYREILQQIPVAKSSLSLWLKSVKLAESQYQRLSDKKLASARRGAQKRKDERIALTKKVKDKARLEIGELSKKEIFLIGVALYWAEGSKEKAHRPSCGTMFSNSDASMIKLYLHWLTDIIKLSNGQIYFTLYLHENNIHRLNEVRKYWQIKTGFPKDNFKFTYFKKHKINTKRKNIGNEYFGLLKVTVMESSILNRKIQGWIEGICQYSGVV